MTEVVVVFRQAEMRADGGRDMTKVGFCVISSFLFFGRNHLTACFSISQASRWPRLPICFDETVFAEFQVVTL